MSLAGIIQRIPRLPQLASSELGIAKFIMCILPVAAIAIGSMYLHDCPRQRYIPIYSIVAGVFGLALVLLSCLPCAQETKDGPPNWLSQMCRTWKSLITSFLFCWFIAGNVWIYSIYQPNYNKNTTSLEPYCHETLYLFAFWTTTLVYILLLLFLFCGCSCLVCFLLCDNDDPDDNV